MTDHVVRLHNRWQLVAEASDEIGKLVTEVPGWPGYEYAPETQNDLWRAAVLLRQVIPLLKQASKREALRLFGEDGIRVPRSTA